MTATLIPFAALIPLVALTDLVAPHELLALLSGLLAALAVAGLVPAPSRRLERLRRERHDAAPPPAWVSSLRRLLGARPDAWPARTRAFCGVLAGLAGALLTTAAALHPPGVRWGAVAGLALGSYLITGKLEPSEVRRRRLQMVIDCPHALELLAACLRAGLPLRSATRAVAEVLDGPLRSDLLEVLRQVELGVPEPDAWRSLRGHPVLGRLAVDLARSVESGTMLVETLRHHARDSRRERRGALEARAKTVGVHSVPPLMVCFLPAFLLIGVVPTGVSAFLHALG